MDALDRILCAVLHICIDDQLALPLHLRILRLCNRKVQRRVPCSQSLARGRAHAEPGQHPWAAEDDEPHAVLCMNCGRTVSRMPVSMMDL